MYDMNKRKHAQLWSTRETRLSETRGGRGGKHGSSDTEGYTNPLTFCLSLGFFAGLIWGTIRGVAYWLKFTKLTPGLLADPFFRISFLKTGWGYAVGIGVFIVFSMICSLLYFALFGKIRGPHMGVVYGFLWWVVIFGFIGPLLGMSDKLTMIGWNTLFTELCIFLLWGIFIGYTIAFEFTDEASREPIAFKMPKLT
jgi:hypothetical protein